MPAREPGTSRTQQRDIALKKRMGSGLDSCPKNAYSSLGAGSGNPSYPGLPQRGLIFNFGLSFGCVSEAPDNVGGIFVNTVVAMPGSLFSLTLHRTLRNELQGALIGLGLPGAALGVTTTNTVLLPTNKEGTCND